MACCLDGAKSLSELVLAYCQLDSWEQISVKFESEFYHFHSRKCIWNCRLPKWRPFCPGRDELRLAWWRHQMEPFSALLGPCAGNSPVTGEFPAKRPVTRSFDVFFHLGLNKRLSKQCWGWWFETPSRPLWRHCNGHSINLLAAVVSQWNGNVISTMWNFHRWLHWKLSYLTTSSAASDENFVKITTFLFQWRVRRGVWGPGLYLMVTVMLVNAWPKYSLMISTGPVCSQFWENCNAL